MMLALLFFLEGPHNVASHRCTVRFILCNKKLQWKVMGFGDVTFPSSGYCSICFSLMLFSGRKGEVSAEEAALSHTLIRKSDLDKDKEQKGGAWCSGSAFYWPYGSLAAMWRKTAALWLGRRWFSVSYSNKFHPVRTSLLWCIPCRNDRLVFEWRGHILAVYSVEICPLALTGQLCSGCTAAPPTGWVMNRRRWGNNCYLFTVLPTHSVVADTSNWGPR